MRLRPLSTLIAVLTVCAFVPAAAQASSKQVSILQDDAVLVGGAQDPGAAMREAKLLGVDVVRAFVTWRDVSPAPNSRTIPAGFDPADPNSRGYNWALYDRFVTLAKRNHLKVMFDLAPGIPYWASQQPKRCPHYIGGYKRLGKGCFWKPSPKLFGKFAAAVARRYGSRASGPFGGQIAYWSLWNEPNLEHYLYPQTQRSRHGSVDFAARRYRELWYAGWKAIARYDPAHKRRVLFGETAAISSPLDTLYAALCLNQNGQPFKRSLRKEQGCSKARRLPIGGFAVHPYNRNAAGSIGQRSFTKDSLTLSYLPRLHKLIKRARHYGRIGKASSGIYITELGFQSKPPDRVYGLPLSVQAQRINEADRLFFGDSLIKSVNQFELYDASQPTKEDNYQTGLRLIAGKVKPAWAAYRMPLYVTRVKSSRVGIWGQARAASGRVRVAIQARKGKGAWKTVKRARTNGAGYFDVDLKRRGASKLRYRTIWNGLTSRTAKVGKRLHYRRG